MATIKEVGMKTILVVDDDISLQKLYREEFETEGYRVMLAGSGEEALDLLEDSRPDLVIMDIRMDGMDGLAAMREILKRDPHIPVILNSAYSNFKTEFASWSAEAYVVKSGDLTELKDEVKKALARREVPRR
jgi:CheY-like chemotaxis protein